MTSAEFASLYQELILEQAALGHGRGDPADFHPQSHQVNPTCGDEITLGIRLAGDRVEEVRWDGRGCTISLASASLLAGIIDGSTTLEALGLIEDFRAVMRSRGQLELDEARFGDAVALNGVPRYVARVKCAMLAWVALEHSLVQASS
ncbi:MAG TPA: SUF system NifU family Fe-S cluster assembly protein [Galbitalea sp.]|jgi:nitrogen fixation NifU-like protein